MIRSISLLFVFAMILTYCAEEKSSAPIPGPAAFSWGQNPDQAISGLSAQGWLLQSQEDGKTVLSFPISEDPELEESELFAEAEKPDEPYTITLYFNEDRLTIATIQRRDTGENIEKFLEVIKELYDLQKPAVSRSGEPETTPAGNAIQTSREVYENESYVIKVDRTKVKVVEERMKGGLNDLVEIQVFPRSENEGISVEGLKE